MVRGIRIYHGSDSKVSFDKDYIRNIHHPPVPILLSLGALTMLKRIPRLIRQHHLTIPVVSMSLVTLAYFLLPLVSYNLTSMTTIGPAIAVVAVWIGLSAAPGKGRIAVLVSSLAWMFVLWYAFPSPKELSTINSWAYQSSFVAIAGGAIATGVLLRIFTRFRFTSANDDQGWTNRSRWGLFDLLLLSFGAALIVSAASAGRITKFVTDPLVVCGVSAAIGAGMTILAFWLWIALSERGWVRGLYVVLVAVCSFWSFSVVDNFSLRSPLRPLTGDYIGDDYLTECLLGLGYPEHEAVWRFVMFIFVFCLPISCGVALGNRLLAFDPPGKTSRIGRLLADGIGWIVTLTFGGGCVFLALAPWKSSLGRLTLHRAGWPFYFYESSSFSGTGIVPIRPPVTHVAIDSQLYRFADIMIALVPVFVLIVMWLVRRNRKQNPRESRIPIFLVPASFLLTVYVGPALIAQQMAASSSNGTSMACVSWLTRPSQQSPKHKDSVRSTSTAGLKRLLATPGGLRTTHLLLIGCELSQTDLALLSQNHCLVQLNFESCSWENDLSPLSKLPHLSALTLQRLKVADADIDAIASFRSLKALHLGGAGGAQWGRWPKNLERLTVTLGTSTQSTWRFEDMRSLSFVVFENQGVQDLRDTDEDGTGRDPIRLEFQRCANVDLHIDSALPVNLDLEKTKLRYLGNFQGMASWRQRKTNPRFVDLRSFRCDDVSVLFRFSACVADCDDFICSSPVGLAAPYSKLELDGVRISRIRSREPRIRLLQSEHTLAKEPSDNIIRQLVAGAPVTELSLWGMKFDPKILASLQTPLGVNRLEFDVSCDGTTITNLVKGMPNLTTLSVPNVALNESQLKMVLNACPSLESLTIGGKNLRTVNLANHQTLVSLTITGDHIPELTDASLKRLGALSLGSAELPDRFISQLLGCDTNIPADLIRRWVATHRRTELNLFRAIESMEVLRELQLKNCTAIIIEGTPVIRSVMETWGVDPSNLSFLQLTDQSPEIAGDHELLKWLKDNLCYETWISTDKREL